MYYVIQVKTGEEEKVINDINRFNTNRSESFNVFSPFRSVLRKYKGKYVQINERCFPGYVFVETDDVKRLFFDLYWVPDFTRLLGRVGKEDYLFAPLSEEETRMINILYDRNDERTTRISDIELSEGDKIRILTGPLRDTETKIKKMDLHKRKVTIEIDMFKRKVDLDVGINIITKIADN